ncbi:MULTISPECIES: MarR family winged helix-turn-helix transcriptional regulator [Streptococcus]|uniref:MarR family winged helix-turn-helix transcriptional regulator n=2 Tax=Streptococcus TaxID=1301 RepID=UPI0002B9F49B|nr:MarR family transcriptional regulator [Streptococcus agalactiae BSU442]KXA59531.1 transcriptional regulator, MarR family [Streptococcus agalactiae]
MIMSNRSILDERLCFTVSETHRLFNKFYQKALDEFQLTYLQYVILLVLWEEDHRHMKELSYALSLNSNTLTPVLKRMENRGGIVREKPRDDKRQLIIHLSNKGIESQDAVVNAVQSCGYFFSEISPESYQKTVSALSSLNQVIKSHL